jgi:hypothetical protein
LETEAPAIVIPFLKIDKYKEKWKGYIIKNKLKRGNVNSHFNWKIKKDIREHYAVL